MDREFFSCRRALCVMALVSLGLTGITSSAAAAVPPAKPPIAAKCQSVTTINGDCLVHAQHYDREWLTYGRTYNQQRFSPLRQINANNVKHLGLTWYYDIGGDRRVQESTPLVVGDVMYVTAAWSRVIALNATTGKVLWTFDPHVPRESGAHGCCGPANRGVALWRGRVFVGTYDGRLIALNATTGRPIWSVRTASWKRDYTITGAPLVVKGRVIIGNGGGEFANRGYVTAYDARTGKQDWRFYTVPGKPGVRDGEPSDGVLNRIARPTWHGQYWKVGGGGTVWDGLSYDPRLDLLYVGTDNGSPWNGEVRSDGRGANLFITSILALRPETGQYVWHFQEVPGDVWDYSATQQMILADLRIDGRMRRVLMQAPKDGLFVIIDRATGKFISAKPFTDINWALGIDSRTGRPQENPQAFYDVRRRRWLAIPGPGGAHNWQPMSYDPDTGLVYLPVMDAAFTYTAATHFIRRRVGWNTGDHFVPLPENPAAIHAIEKHLTGYLVAWNPRTQRQAWAAHIGTPWNGGVVATAGNLVFQGDSMGRFAAFRATDGKRLWSVATHTGIVAPPITYEVDGQQYVAIETGWGGAFALAAGKLALDTQINQGNVPHLLVFKLGGQAKMPTPPSRAISWPAPPRLTASPRIVAEGRASYQQFCSACHGDSAVSGGVLPDLRHVAALGVPALWQRIVRGGILRAGGMVSFASDLTSAEAESVRDYVIYRANETLQQAQRPVAHRQTTRRR